jgi:hypothetical protein
MEGCLDILHRILETLAVRFPKAQFVVKATELKLGASCHASRPSYTTLNHAAAHHLTEFYYSPSHKDQFYYGFKQGVGSMLQHNNVLRKFQLHDFLLQGVL